MILRKIAQGIREHDWFVVLVELMVVVIGLMMAFQVDRWREVRDEHRQERDYIERLTDDLEADIPAITFAIEMQTTRLDLVELLMAAVDDPEAALTRPAEFLAAIYQAAYTYTPTLTSHTFEDLRSTGNMRLIRNRNVKDALYEYYGFDQSQWQYRPLQFTTEFKHFEEVAGVLSFDQARLVQDEILFVNQQTLDRVRSIEVDKVEVLLAAKRLAERPGIRAWLPQIRGLQLEQISVHKSRLDRAHTVLETLKQHAANSN